MYAGLPQVAALADKIDERSVRTVLLEGLAASSAPMLFGGLAGRCGVTVLFILTDADEAGYFYHDLTQIMGQEQVLYLPSSYRRAVKYGQRDPASEILRTEALAALSGRRPFPSLYIVSYPEAVAELVVSRKRMDSRTLELAGGQCIDVTDVMRTLRGFGFHEVD